MGKAGPSTAACALLEPSPYRPRASRGIAPDVVAMPAGQGHENVTRYATGRGANPISILAPIAESETGALAWAATRVKINRVADADGSLVLFAGSLREYPPEKPHR